MAESATSRRPIEDQEQSFLAFVQQHHASLIDRYEILPYLRYNDEKSTTVGKNYLRAVPLLLTVDQ